MKRYLAFLLAALMLLSFAACAKDEKEASSPTEAPTAAPTEAATEAPTEEPTEAPTEAPTEEPTPEPTNTPEPTEAPVFPGVPQTGKLVDGPIFTEPGKYLVLKGDGDLFYVYNSMGEFVKTISAVDDEYDHSGVGIFGEDGICHNVRIATGEPVPNFEILGDMLFTYEWVEEEGDGYRYYPCLISVLNEDLTPKFSFEPGEMGLGEVGGILHIEGKYLVMERDIDWGDWESENVKINYVSTPKLLGPDGRLIKELDLSELGNIAGVYGGKYLVTKKSTGRFDEWGVEEEFEYAIYTLEGELVMDKVDPVYDSWFCADDELWMGDFHSYSYLTDENGVCYDAELNVVESVPEYGAPNRLREKFWELGYDDLVIDYWGTFVGVKTAEGEWLFKIYNPGYAEDHDQWHDY